MAPDNDSVLKGLVSRSVLEHVSERLHIRMMVPFGSFAPGGLESGPDSDIDLALAFDRAAGRPDFFELHRVLGAAFPERTLDPVFLHDADPLFRWEIMERGVLLHGDVDEFLELHAFAYRDFVDPADLRELEKVLFVKKMDRIAERLRVAS